jgi:hypothetical protein
MERLMMLLLGENRALDRGHIAVFYAFNFIQLIMQEYDSKCLKIIITLKVF